jgi:glycosyltransferase involved in cell wall biosynthesis
MTVPEVVIAIPTMGTRPEWLNLTIESVEQQKHPNVLIRIVTPDPTRVNVSPTVRTPIEVIQAAASGLSDAINTGIKDVEARYVTWIGDDDLLAPGSLACTHQALEKHRNAPYVYGRTRYIDERGKTIGYTRPTSLAHRYLKYGKDFVPQPGSLLRAHALREVGYLNSELKNAMDLDLFIKLGEIGRPVYVPRELSAYRLHPASITLTKGVNDEAEVVRAHYRGVHINRLHPVWRPPLRILDRVVDVWFRRGHCPAVPKVENREYTRAVRR